MRYTVFLASLALLFIFPQHAGLAEPPLGAFMNPKTQADYVIITPKAYLPTLEPLAAFRTTHNGFSVLAITTEEIYAAFGEGMPSDSAIREFVTFALVTWEDPNPQFFLLAGNVNSVPSHKEPGVEFIGEDSIMVDQWFVEGVVDSSGIILPSAAIGRFPGWDSTQLAAMVAKTIAYESMSDSTWFDRSIAVADHEPGSNIFESQANACAEIISDLWTDTTTVHVLETSPSYLSREEFRGLINQGTALILTIGHHEWFAFSHSHYFTTWDVDSLDNSERLPFWIINESQRFEREDTLAMAVNLLQTTDKGAVGSMGPTGHTFLVEHFGFLAALLNEMVANPGTPIGSVLLNVKQVPMRRAYRIVALLADPALEIRTTVTTGMDNDPPVLPIVVTLKQNYPNPFNPTTTFEFSIPTSLFANLSVYNLLGENVVTVIDEQLAAGTHRVHWDATGQPSGVYFYRLRAGGFTETKKLVLLR